MSAGLVEPAEAIGRQPKAARPLLITMGDACGIGPETIVRAAMQRTASSQRGAQEPPWCVVGDAAVLARAQALLGPQAQALSLRPVPAPEQAAALPPASLAVWSPPGLAPGLALLPWGQVSAQAGAAAAACVRAAAALALAGRGRAVVTAPLHKEALAQAGVPYPGHTEMLQALATKPGAGPPPVRMMLANEELKVVLVTIHVALRQAIAMLSTEGVLETLRIAHASGRAWGMAAPRLAVAGLNPHAGEGGLFGDEEIRIIAPAIAQARAEGMDASGPHPPDTVFMRARHTAHKPGAFDIVVAMTHDHGLIPVKYLGVEEGVNLTLGLPFVRTSPDHGTAFDIAGRGRADARSLQAALRMAERLSAAA